MSSLTLVTKCILKKACEGIIPSEIIYRKKIGFAAPIVRWLNHGKYFPKYFKKTLTTNNYADSVKQWTIQNYLTVAQNTSS